MIFFKMGFKIVSVSYGFHDKLFANLVAWISMNLSPYSSGGQKSKNSFKGLKLRYCQVWFLLETLGETLFSCRV